MVRYRASEERLTERAKQNQDEEKVFTHRTEHDIDSIDPMSVVVSIFRCMFMVVYAIMNHSWVCEIAVPHGLNSISSLCIFIVGLVGV